MEKRRTILDTPEKYLFRALFKLGFVGSLLGFFFVASIVTVVSGKLHIKGIPTIMGLFSEWLLMML